MISVELSEDIDESVLGLVGVPAQLRERVAFEVVLGIVLVHEDDVLVAEEHAAVKHVQTADIGALRVQMLMQFVEGFVHNDALQW